MCSRKGRGVLRFELSALISEHGRVVDHCLSLAVPPDRTCRTRVVSRYRSTIVSKNGIPSADSGSQILVPER
jgi:hypothetical protein